MTSARVWFPVLAVVILVFGLTTSGYGSFVAALVLPWALAAVGLNLVTGRLYGVSEPLALSFGQSAFLGIGGYFSAYASDEWGWNFFLATIVAAALSAALGALLAAVGARLGLFGLAMVTFSLAFLAQVLASGRALSAVTNAELGRSVLPPTLFGLDLSNGKAMYFTVAVIFLLGLVAARQIRSSSFGTALQVARRSEALANALGMNVARQKVIVFAVAAAYASVAGSLLGMVNGIVTPDLAGALGSVNLVAMVVVGGSGYLIGPVLGAGYFVGLPQLLSQFQNHTTLILAATLLVVLVAAPGGLAGIVVDLVRAPRARRARRARQAAAGSGPATTAPTDGSGPAATEALR